MQSSICLGGVFSKLVRQFSCEFFTLDLLDIMISYSYASRLYLALMYDFGGLGVGQRSMAIVYDSRASRPRSGSHSYCVPARMYIKYIIHYKQYFPPIL
jgi:hypothetical protein